MKYSLGKAATHSLKYIALTEKWILTASADGKI